MKPVLFVQHNITITSPQWTTSSEPREETTDWLSMLVKEKMLETSGRLSADREEVVISSLIAEVILTKPALLHVCGSRSSQLDSLTFIKWSSELKHLQEEQESTNTNILLGKYIPTPWTHVERDNEQNSSLPADEQLTDIMWSCGQLSVWTLVCLPPTHESLWNRLFCIMNQNQNQSWEVIARTQSTESGQCEGHCGGFEHSWGWLQAFNALKL